MARFNASEIENYGGQGGGGFFSLKADKETARVRFMYDKPEDVEGFSVHEVEFDGKKRYVNCLREYNDPLDVCPFCAARKPTQAKLFIPLYNVDEDICQVWERGKKFYATLSGVLARTKGHIASHIFEIERNGKPKDSQTTYGIYPVEHDDITLADLPEIDDILGSVVLEKTAREMDIYLRTGSFPGAHTTEDLPRRRTSRREEEEEEEVPRRRSGAAVERRTPASTGRTSAKGRTVRMADALEDDLQEEIKARRETEDEEVF